jgi:pimeloyl-ACP methyl ester carboxylesterase
MCDRLNPEDAVDTVENEIYGITAPTLVIAGEIDRHIPLWHSQTYAQKIPQGYLEIIKGADHDLVETHSTEIAHLIQQYW